MPGLEVFTGKFNQTLKKEITPILRPLSEYVGRGNTQQLILWGSIAWSETKDGTEKEKYRPISLMNIDPKILKKILARSTQQYKKNNTPWPKTSFILGMQDWFNIQKLINVINYIKSIEETTWSHQLMQKNHLKKCNIHSWLETPSKLGREGTSSASHPVKGDLWKSQLTLFFMEKLNAFPLSSHIRQGCPLSLFNIILSLNAIRKEKEMKVRQKKKKK